MSEMTTRRRARSGGGAARRAARETVSFETARFIRRNIPNLEVMNDEALEIIEANAEVMLEEVGVSFVNNPGALQRWREAGADVDGERVHIPRGLARKLCETAPSSYVQHARNPERSVEVGGAQSGAGAGLWPTVCARCRRWPALCHDGGFPQIREAGLHVEMAAPFRRHGV